MPMFEKDGKKLYANPLKAIQMLFSQNLEKLGYLRTLIFMKASKNETESNLAEEFTKNYHELKI